MGRGSMVSHACGGRVMSCARPFSFEFIAPVESPSRLLRRRETGVVGSPPVSARGRRLTPSCTRLLLAGLERGVEEGGRVSRGERREEFNPKATGTFLDGRQGKKQTSAEQAREAALFSVRKRDCMEALESLEQDRSRRGAVDPQIVPLLRKLNAQADHYSTSCCAGRVQILGLQPDFRKHSTVWLFSDHSGVTGGQIEDCLSAVERQERPDSPEKSEGANGWVVRKDRDAAKEGNEGLMGGSEQTGKGTDVQIEELWLHCESPIVHTASRSLEAALELLHACKARGLKHSGIISVKEGKVMSEFVGNMRIAIPLWTRQGGLLVSGGGGGGVVSTNSSSYGLRELPSGSEDVIMWTDKGGATVGASGGRQGDSVVDPPDCPGGFDPLAAFATQKLLSARAQFFEAFQGALEHLNES
uniref:tRNA(Phe) 7-[(3-amino-3-carboxypropyl)-4-demethylwyosine(37)-N(4)]-methyltransferase n=1 Tax=Chromera velia CCMP2878 TaxID=1169474 RepID=A0A0G4HQF5_9ALVE|eukprot:Cvel_7929.t1-p1 / transcript=Cvel_7929.t1 / gene=Cvel_7929 / organism=Chromera_velia_CCMP2878 / gene_product=UPF0130 protein TK0175, putative / transcript_product=UPF0130 protein TK0175, putative / location=Cvel_scaffold425:51025-54491(-) / protein_length=415 / sequence_SO=supercontig / SO=protein_coding / is_pseudo=false